MNNNHASSVPSGNDNDAFSGMMAPPQRGPPRPAQQQRASPFGPGGINQGGGILSQNTIIKSITSIMPKISGDPERQSIREQMIDALVRQN
jgi:hypothetical protein